MGVAAKPQVRKGELDMSMIRIFIVTIFTLFFVGGLEAAENTGTLDLDEKRKEALKQFAGKEIPNPTNVKSLAKSIFQKPIDAQTEAELKLVANQANRLANLIGYLNSEYSSYYRKSYKYKFVQKEVVGPHDAYVEESNALKRIRDRAYFSLGMKAKTKGEPLRAFMLFKDAFRLSSFDCGPGKPKEDCLRWKAEQEMKKLLFTVIILQSFIL